MLGRPQSAPDASTAPFCVTLTNKKRVRHYGNFTPLMQISRIWAEIESQQGLEGGVNRKIGGYDLVIRGYDLVSGGPHLLAGGHNLFLKYFLPQPTSPAIVET